MKRREGCGAVSPLASYVLRLNRAFCVFVANRFCIALDRHRGLSLRLRGRGMRRTQRRGNDEAAVGLWGGLPSCVLPLAS